MSRRSPWLFVPPLYFQQGLPVILVQQFSVLLYKKLGVPNEQIALWTSLITWPWIIKMFWGPLVDVTGSKRRWVLAMQALIIVALGGATLAVTSSAFLPVTLAIFFGVAFLSATHDIALDGYYLVALDRDDQALFVGIRSTFFRLAMIFCTGALVIAAGIWERNGVAVAFAWQYAMALGIALYALLTLHAHFVMPRPSADRAAPGGERAFAEAFRSFFTQKDARVIVAFILVYRFGESMLSKMSGLFLLDPRSAGGLGLDTVQVGSVMGNVGVISLVSGGLLGGYAISRFGLRRLLWPMALVMHVPNLLYVWASATQPGLSSVYGVVAVDQFGYGFGLAAYLVYAMEICRGSRYQSSQYAIVSALMALGAMVAGITSGYLQKHLGYTGFFTAVCLSTIPGMFLLGMIPLGPEESGVRAENVAVPGARAEAEAT